jgi:hypothetical protein
LLGTDAVQLMHQTRNGFESDCSAAILLRRIFSADDFAIGALTQLSGDADVFGACQRLSNSGADWIDVHAPSSAGERKRDFQKRLVHSSSALARLAMPSLSSFLSQNSQNTAKTTRRCVVDLNFEDASIDVHD